MTRGSGKTPMTSRDLQAAERREQLLAAAKELFAEKGYHATSIRDIHRKVGIADGLIYHYFPNGKQEMLQTIVREGHEQRLEKISGALRAIPDDVPIRELLRRFAKRVYDVLLEDKQLMIIQFREKEMIDAELTEELSIQLRERQKLMFENLVRRAQKGQIRDMDFEMAVKLFVAANAVFVIRELSGIDMIGMDHQEYLDRLVDLTMELWQP